MRRLSARGLVDLAICGDITPQQAERVHQLRGPVADTEHQRPFVPAISTSGAVIPVYKGEIRRPTCESMRLATWHCTKTIRWAPRSRWLWLRLAVPPPLAWWTVFRKGRSCVHRASPYWMASSGGSGHGAHGFDLRGGNLRYDACTDARRMGPLHRNGYHRRRTGKRSPSSASIPRKSTGR